MLKAKFYDADRRFKKAQNHAVRSSSWGWRNCEKLHALFNHLYRPVRFHDHVYLIGCKHLFFGDNLFNGFLNLLLQKTTHRAARRGGCKLNYDLLIIKADLVDQPQVNNIYTQFRIDDTPQFPDYPASYFSFLIRHSFSLSQDLTD